MGRRICFALDLVNDAELIAANEAAHGAGHVWPQAISGIRQCGYLDMEIWRVADRLVMNAEVEEDWPRSIDPDLDAPEWAPMQRIFALDEQQGQQS